MISPWTDRVQLPSFPKLSGNVKTQVLIIGGGMAGVLCAYYLQRAGVDYLLVESKTIGSGITKNTTAKLTAQHGLIYYQLIKKQGKENAAAYLAANCQALEDYRSMCQSIACDYQEKDAFVYSLDGRKKLEQELQALQSLNYPAHIADKLPLPFETDGAVVFPGQAQFNPLRFLGAVAEGLHIYENTPVKEMAPHTATVDGGTITADKIIVATHFPFINKHGSYFLKLYQHRSYAIALENADNVNGMYLDEAEAGMSFRNYNNLLIIGGGDHRTGKSGGNWQELREFAARHYPNEVEKYSWATQDCMSLDGVPYIGRYSKSTPEMFVATGFNKWGMTSSMVAARLLTDMVRGRKSPYEDVFSPSRSMLTSQLAINGWEATANMLSITPKRCPHLGCALKWNAVEHSWDCPCHGSRFGKDGSLIDNPATGNLNMR